MSDTDFQKTLLATVEEYISAASYLCDILIALKSALLSFDNAKLNRVLDEKLVVNEQVLYVNAALEGIIKDRYGDFSAKSSHALQEEFPAIQPKWTMLRNTIKAIKSHAFEVRRIIAAIEKYHIDLNFALDGAKSKLYKNYADKG